MKGFVCIVLLLLIMTGLAGCSRTPLRSLALDTEGPRPLMQTKQFRKIDLAALVAPDVDDGQRTGGRWWSGWRSEQQRLQRAFRLFYENPADQKPRRSRVQDAIVNVSNLRCAEFKQFLLRSDVRRNFALGLITTASAGLGPVFSSVSTVRALSGGAAIASGIRAEHNQVYFRKKTIDVLSKGFERRRKEIHQEILGKRTCNIDYYTVERAIGDAIKYDDACSLLVGLETMAADQQRANDPGLERVEEIMKRLKHTNEAAQQAVDAAQNEKPSSLDNPHAPFRNLGHSHTMLVADLKQEGVGKPKEDDPCLQ